MSSFVSLCQPLASFAFRAFKASLRAFMMPLHIPLPFFALPLFFCQLGVTLLSFVSLTIIRHFVRLCLPLCQFV